MKVIFIKDLKKQAKKDDIKEVKDGYAKYLIGEGIAVQYSDKSSEILEKEKETRKIDEDNLIKECNSIKKKLEKENLKFKVKTGNLDRVFGSISSKQISEELKKLGYDIDKKKISINGDINTLGMHIVHIELHKKVISELKVELIK